MQEQENHYLVFGPQEILIDNYLYSNYIGDYVAFYVPNYINSNNWKEYKLLTEYFKCINFYPNELFFSNCIDCSELCDYNDKIFILKDIDKLINYSDLAVIVHIFDRNIELINIKQYGSFSEDIKVIDDDELSWFIIECDGSNKYDWDKIKDCMGTNKIW